MSKKSFSQIFAIATLGGLVAAGITYILQYKAFHKELEEEFHNFEEEPEPVTDARSTDRNYVALHANKDEFVVAAKETAHAAKGMAGAAKDMLKDVGSILKNQASDLKSVAADSAESLKEKLEKHKKTNKTSSDLSDTMPANRKDNENDSIKTNPTQIIEQQEDSVLPSVSDVEDVASDVHIKNAKLQSEESTIIDLSKEKDE